MFKELYIFKKILGNMRIVRNVPYVWFISLFLTFLSSCLGVGTNIKVEENLEIISYDKAFDIALETAKEIHFKCRNINPYNYPTLVDIGISKSRGVITIHYKYDPAAGSVCSPPPEPIRVMTKGFVPHFGAEFYMHIKFIKIDNMTKGINIEITQWKGIKKEEFVNEMIKLKDLYLKYLKQNWR